MRPHPCADGGIFGLFAWAAEVPGGVDVCVIVCLWKSARATCALDTMRPRAPADMQVCMGGGVTYTARLM